MARPRILLADDHTLMADALRHLLQAEFDVVGTVADGRALLVAASELKPDLAVAYMYRGVLFTQQGDLKRASADHARLLKLDRKLAAKLEAVIVSRVLHEGNEGLAAQYE